MVYCNKAFDWTRNSNRDFDWTKSRSSNVSAIHSVLVWVSSGSAFESNSEVLSFVHTCISKRCEIQSPWGDLLTVIVYPKTLCKIVAHRLNVAKFQMRTFLRLSQKCFLFSIFSHKSFRLLQEVLMPKFELVRNIFLLQDIQNNITWYIVSKNLIGLEIVTKIMIGSKVGQTKNLQFSQFLGELRVKALLSLIWMWRRAFQILEGVFSVLKYINRYMKNNITWYIVTGPLIGPGILTEILIEPKVGQATYLHFIQFLYGFQARVLLSLTRKCSRLHTLAFQSNVRFRVLEKDLSTAIIYPRVLCETVVHRLNMMRFQMRIFLRLSQKCFPFLISSHKSFRLFQEVWSSMSVCPKILHEVLMLKFDIVRNIFLLQDIQNNIIWHIVSKNLIGLGIVTKTMIGPKVGQTKNLQFSQFLGSFRVKTLLSMILMWLHAFQILENVMSVLINKHILLKHKNNISNIIRFSFEKLWSSEILFINKVIAN